VDVKIDQTYVADVFFKVRFNSNGHVFFYVTKSSYVWVFLGTCCTVFYRKYLGDMFPIDMVFFHRVFMSQFASLRILLIV